MPSTVTAVFNVHLPFTIAQERVSVPSSLPLIQTGQWVESQQKRITAAYMHCHGVSKPRFESSNKKNKNISSLAHLI